jgi:hypothetical protein
MPRKPKKPAEKLAPVADEVLDQFGPASGMSMADIDSATRRLKRALMERMLAGELTPGGEAWLQVRGRTDEPIEGQSDVEISIHDARPIQTQHDRTCIFVHSVTVFACSIETTTEYFPNCVRRV